MPRQCLDPRNTCPCFVSVVNVIWCENPAAQGWLPSAGGVRGSWQREDCNGSEDDGWELKWMGGVGLAVHGGADGAFPDDELVALEGSYCHSIDKVRHVSRMELSEELELVPRNWGQARLLPHRQRSVLCRHVHFRVRVRQLRQDIVARLCMVRMGTVVRPPRRSLWRNHIDWLPPPRSRLADARAHLSPLLLQQSFPRCFDREPREPPTVFQPGQRAARPEFEQNLIAASFMTICERGSPIRFSTKITTHLVWNVTVT